MNGKIKLDCTDGLKFVRVEIGDYDTTNHETDDRSFIAGKKSNGELFMGDAFGFTKKQKQAILNMVDEIITIQN